MSGKFAPIGQMMPSSRRASSSLPKYSTQQASNLSFQDVLGRYQATKAETRAQAPQFSQNLQPRATAGRSAGTSSMPAIPNQTNAIPSEALDLVNKMPNQVPEGNAFEKQVLNNMKEYWAMKKEAAQNPSDPKPLLPTADDIRANKGRKASGQESAFGAAFASASQPITDNQPVHQPRNTQSTASVTAKDEFKPVIYPTNSAKTQLAEHPGAFAQPGQSQATKSGREAVEPNAAQEKPKKSGFFGAVTSFFKNVFSGLTLGAYRPDGEEAPKGLGRVVYPFKKLVYDAPKDIAIGVPTGIYNDVGSAIHKDSDKETHSPRVRTTLNQSANEYLNRPRWTSLDDFDTKQSRKSA